MGKVYCILICYLIVVPTRSQVNLILNPSFEILDSCPTFWNQIDRAKFWNNMDNNPLNEYCKGQLMHRCAPNSLVSVPTETPSLSTRFQWPRTGYGYCSLSLFPPPPPNFTNYREYTIGTLTKTLINGKSYCGKVYINLGNDSPYKINRFGMYFDNGSLIGTQTDCYTVLNAIPQIQNNLIFIMNDTLGWMKIENIFTAIGTENRVTIGNFYTDAQTTAIATNFLGTFGVALYNIDDLSLIATDITAYAGNDATICVTDSIHLGRPQEVGLECLWYKPTIATPFASTSDIWFKPTQTGTYTFIQRMDNCAITWDTVNITVIQDCSLLLPTKEIPNVFTPNGDGVNDSFLFSVVGATNVSFNIMNRWGNLIQSVTSRASVTNVLWDGRTTSGEACSEGVYFYTLQYTNANGDAIKKNGYVTLIR